MMKPQFVRGIRGRASATLTLATALVVCMALLCTAGCGQKGPLYLPEPAPAVVPAPEVTPEDAKDKQKRDAAGNSAAPTGNTAPAASAH